MASERIYAPVSRPVPRTCVISSHAMLGGLHQHYARVRGRRHAGRMRSGTDRPPGHLAISFGSRGADTSGSRAALHRASIFCRGVAAAPKATSATSHPLPERAIKIDEIRRDLRVAVGKIIFALEQLGLCRDDIQDRTRPRLGVQTRSPKWRL
jgi:hypothetical protein